MCQYIHLATGNTTGSPHCLIYFIDVAWYGNRFSQRFLSLHLHWRWSNRHVMNAERQPSYLNMNNSSTSVAYEMSLGSWMTCLNPEAKRRTRRTCSYKDKSFTTMVKHKLSPYYRNNCTFTSMRFNDKTSTVYKWIPSLTNSE